MTARASGGILSTMTSRTARRTPTIGTALRRWRLARGLSLRGLAARAGVDHTTIVRIEAGRVSPTVHLLARLARALDTTVPALFGPPPSARRRRKAPKPRGRWARQGVARAEATARSRPRGPQGEGGPPASWRSNTTGRARMTLAEVKRRYGIHGGMARRMIEFGYESADGTTRKLEATRTGRRWGVAQAALDRWAAEYDAATLAQITAAFAKGRRFVQFFPDVSQEVIQSCSRLTAAGDLQCGDVVCQDSGIPHLTCFPPDGRPGCELLPIGSGRRDTGGRKTLSTRRKAGRRVPPRGGETGGRRTTRGRDGGAG